MQTTAAVDAATGISAYNVAGNTDPSIVYSGSWQKVATADGIGLSSAVLSGTGFARFSFTGTEASWTGKKGPSAGIADVYVDGVKVNTVDVYAPTSSSSVLYSVRGLADANHTLEVRSTLSRNTSSTGSEITVDSMSAGATFLSSSTTYGAFGRPFDVDPDSKVAVAIRSTASSSERAELAAIGSQPLGAWFGDWNFDITADVRKRVTQADARGAVATLVMYNIPHRDCGDYSANQVTSADAYRQWVRQFVAGLGSSRHIVIIEPDALSLTWCLTTAERLERFSLMSYAVSLVAQQGSWSYLDAGNNLWLTPEETAARLNLAGVAQATGFALNISNFKATDLLLAQGLRVSALVNGKHFVIDTSRNGIPLSANEWCNPPGTALGNNPSVTTASPLADAYLWIKPPGESDGPCNGGPPPGSWFDSYALTLVRNAKL